MTKRFFQVALLAVVLFGLCQAAQAAPIAIDTVLVGNPGNPDDSHARVAGGVAYEYRIGKYETTNAQYAAFLNAVDPTGTDPLDIDLYNSQMGSNATGGISFVSGNADGSKYVIKTNMGNKPVNYVNFWDAARFANWLHNGQGGPGTTETGAYLLNGVKTPNPSLLVRENGAMWFIPNEDEWYKAAYYDPRFQVQGGPPGNDNYWLHATQSDIGPTPATADSVGDITNPGSNVANYAGVAWTGRVTTVGSALSESFYGTFDQAANVLEWNEAFPGSLLRGGGYPAGTGTNSKDIGAEFGWIAHASINTEASDVGFRVATFTDPVNVPEPTSLALAGLGFAILLLWRKRRGR